MLGPPYKVRSIEVVLKEARCKQLKEFLRRHSDKVALSLTVRKKKRQQVQPLWVSRAQFDSALQVSRQTSRVSAGSFRRGKSGYSYVRQEVSNAQLLQLDRRVKNVLQEFDRCNRAQEPFRNTRTVGTAVKELKQIELDSIEDIQEEHQQPQPVRPAPHRRIKLRWHDTERR